MSSQIVNFDEMLLNHIKNGRNNEVKSLIRNINEAHKLIDNAGSTLLHYAAAYGNGGIAKYLIDLGSNINAQDLRGRTPLMLAIQEERVTTIRVLLEYKANIHITDNIGISSLEIVVESNFISENTIVMFLNRLKDESSMDSRLVAQLLRDINCSLRKALLLDDAEVTRWMLNEGNYDIDDPDPEMGDTALHIAVRHGSLQHVKLLIEYGANVNVHNDTGYTPLSNLEFESMDESLEMLKLLLDRGEMMFSRTNDTNKWQVKTILQCGCKRAINLLIQYDIDLRAVDSHGSTALHYLASNFNEGVFDELKDKKFDVNARNYDHYTPLHKVWDNLSSIKFLIDHGADVNACRYGVTPFTQIFQRARLFPKIKIRENCALKLFLKHGADPQVISFEGDTIFDDVVDDNTFFKLISVVAHLALLEDTGTPIVELIRRRIEANAKLHEFYCKCKAEIQNLKITVVQESITAYKLLTVSDKQLAMYMRQGDLIATFVKDPSCLPIYKEMMQERVEKAILTALLWENSTSSFCDLLKLPCEKYYYVIESMVISYLNENDMRNLALLNEK